MELPLSGNIILRVKVLCGAKVTMGTPCFYRMFMVYDRIAEGSMSYAILNLLHLVPHFCSTEYPLTEIMKNFFPHTIPRNSKINSG